MYIEREEIAKTTGAFGNSSITMLITFQCRGMPATFILAGRQERACAEEPGLKVREHTRVASPALSHHEPLAVGMATSHGYQDMNIGGMKHDSPSG